MQIFFRKIYVVGRKENNFFFEFETLRSTVIKIKDLSLRPFAFNALKIDARERRNHRSSILGKRAEIGLDLETFPRKIASSTLAAYEKCLMQ